LNHRYLEPARIARLILTAVLMYLPSPLAAQDAKRVPTNEAMHAVIAKTSPEYPAIAKQMRLTGDVNLDVTVSEDGSVTDVAVLQGNPVLAKPASDAVRGWKFTPFKFDGKPAKVITTIVIKFAL